jgi:hypothetical protein
MTIVGPKTTTTGSRLRRGRLDSCAGYAKRVVARLKKDDPQTLENELRNAEGTDVDDRRVLDWIMRWCASKPEDPLLKAVFF